MMATAGLPLVELLLVEDNPGDVCLAREELRDGQVRHRLSVARDGVDALAFLRRVGVYADAPRPDLILLDLGLPRKDGHEVLQELRADPSLRAIPVAVLTASPEHQEHLIREGLAVSHFLNKPLEAVHLLALMARILVAGLPSSQQPEGYGPPPG